MIKLSQSLTYVTGLHKLCRPSVSQVPALRTFRLFPRMNTRKQKLRPLFIAHNVWAIRLTSFITPKTVRQKRVRRIQRQQRYIGYPYRHQLCMIRCPPWWCPSMLMSGWSSYQKEGCLRVRALTEPWSVRYVLLCSKVAYWNTRRTK